MPDEAPRSTGRLKVILGFAAGVGKTYKMLLEGHQLAAQGKDVVVGYFEPHGRADTIAAAQGLEFVPRRVIHYRDRDFEEMDTPAILARSPAICLVDELPHTNVPGAERAKRWEDVLVLIDAGIDVIATMNIQHLESLNDRVRAISGIEVRETVPDWVLQRASEVVMADLTPQALLNRLDRGVVYAPEKAERAKQNFFKEPTLAALREMALRQTAHEVDMRQAPPTAFPAASASAPERILIHITPAPATAALIRRARRVADYLQAACFAVCVLPGPTIDSLPPDRRREIERHLDFARRLHIETRILEGEDEAQALSAFAHTNAVTQIFLAKPPRGALPFSQARRLVMKVVRLAQDTQVTVVAERRSVAPR
jgi:two-component system sensor histidine kinase KdpD